MRPPSHDLHLVRAFAATREELWEAFTVPEAIASWFGPVGFHVPLASVRVEPLVGGVQRLTMVSDVDRQVRQSVDARYTEVVPGERLVSVEDLHDGFGMMRLALRLHDGPDGGSVLVLDQGPYPEAMLVMAGRGWESSFTKLDACFAGPNATPVHPATAVAPAGPPASRR